MKPHHVLSGFVAGVFIGAGQWLALAVCCAFLANLRCSHPPPFLK